MKFRKLAMELGMVLGIVFFFGLCALLALSIWQHRYDVKWAKCKVELMQVAKQGQEIIDALEAYRKMYGAYPASLDALVPKFIARLPSPGQLDTDGIWHYEKGGLYSKQTPYELFIRPPHDFAPAFSFGDTFVYWPTGKYPREAYGGVLERIDGWGYCHE